MPVIPLGGLLKFPDDDPSEWAGISTGPEHAAAGCPLCKAWDHLTSPVFYGGRDETRRDYPRRYEVVRAHHVALQKAKHGS